MRHLRGDVRTAGRLARNAPPGINPLDQESDEGSPELRTHAGDYPPSKGEAVSVNVLDSTKSMWAATKQEILRAHQQADEWARLRPNLAQDPGQAGENFRNSRAAIILLDDEFHRTFAQASFGPGDSLILTMFDDRLSHARITLTAALASTSGQTTRTGWIIAIAPTLGVLALFAGSLRL